MRNYELHWEIVRHEGTRSPLWRAECGLIRQSLRHRLTVREKACTAIVYTGMRVALCDAQGACDTLTSE
jgi:hypothetical protein